MKVKKLSSRPKNVTGAVLEIECFVKVEVATWGGGYVKGNEFVHKLNQGCPWSTGWAKFYLNIQ